MILKTVTGLALRLIRREDAPERLLIVEPPCQSDLKRTLRQRGAPPDTASSQGFLDDLTTSSAGMVNTGFPRDPHGFEMVDGRGRRAHGTDVNRKFTTPSIAKILESIFRELSGRQSLAIYRELLGPTSAEIAATGSNIQVARCAFCFASHSGSDGCWCSCRGTRRPNRTRCRRSAAAQRCRLRPRPSPTGLSSASASRRPARAGGRPPP